MKKISLKNSILALVALCALGLLNVASAHDVNGSLGKASSAIDYYQVQCFDDGSGPTDHLDVAIKNNSRGAAKLSVQVIRDNTATNATDAANGNATYSPVVNQKGSDGFFYMTVDKTAVGVVNYSLQYHCQTSDQQHTGTNIFQLTNQ